MKNPDYRNWIEIRDCVTREVLWIAHDKEHVVKYGIRKMSRMDPTIQTAEQAKGEAEGLLKEHCWIEEDRPTEAEAGQILMGRVVRRLA